VFGLGVDIGVTFGVGARTVHLWESYVRWSSQNFSLHRSHVHGKKSNLFAR
jgi:hypothetical protein